MPVRCHPVTLPFACRLRTIDHPPRPGAGSRAEPHVRLACRASPVSHLAMDCLGGRDGGHAVADAERSAGDVNAPRHQAPGASAPRSPTCPVTPAARPDRRYRQQAGHTRGLRACIDADRHEHHAGRRATGHPSASGLSQRSRCSSVPCSTSRRSQPRRVDRAGQRGPALRQGAPHRHPLLHRKAPLTVLTRDQGTSTRDPSTE